jgi:hypothetical protein
MSSVYRNGRVWSALCLLTYCAAFPHSQGSDGTHRKDATWTDRFISLRKSDSSFSSGTGEVRKVDPDAKEALEAGI